jgi:membrane protease YdiL (CAAX protease family)
VDLAKDKLKQLPLRGVIPGILLVSIVDALTIADRWPDDVLWNLAYSLVLVILPLITIAVLRLPPVSLGYDRRDLLRSFGWGMVAGGFWRLISLLLNLWLVNPGWSPVLGFGQLFGALIWVPLVEETFFRGYLGRALSSALGMWPGILIQAIFFSLQPVHWQQGLLALMSIFGFGLLAGWLQHRFNNIWAPWGAHALANLLALLLLIGH